MKEKLLIGCLVGLFAWNVWLSLPEKKESEKINYKLYQELFKQSERRFELFTNEIKNLNDEIFKDSVFVVNSSRTERDSLRAKFNPR